MVNDEGSYSIVKRVDRYQTVFASVPSALCWMSAEVCNLRKQSVNIVELLQSRSVVLYCYPTIRLQIITIFTIFIIIIVLIALGFTTSSILLLCVSFLAVEALIILWN